MGHLECDFYVLCEGCTWRGLPGDFPPWQTVYNYFRRWQTYGTLLAIHDELYVLSRLVEGRSDSPSELIVDSQSVKTAMMIAIAAGYDGAKKVKGRKRHLTIDTLGLILTAADGHCLVRLTNLAHLKGLTTTIAFYRVSRLFQKPLQSE